MDVVNLYRTILLMGILEGCLNCDSFHGVDQVLNNSTYDKCYYVNKTHFLYKDAKEFCQEKNLHLITLETHDEEEWILQSLKSLGIIGFQYWLGVEYMCGQWILPMGCRATTEPRDVDVLLTKRDPNPSYAYVNPGIGWESINDDADHERAFICESYDGDCPVSVQHLVCPSPYQDQVEMLDEFHSSPSLMSCVNQCLGNIRCFSILYSHQEKRCKTFSSDTKARTPLLSESDYLFYVVRK